MIGVLIVEDEPLTAQAHRAFVERVAGYRVVGVAGTGSEAIRALNAATTDGAEPIDLLLLDMGLPDMTGLDLCRRLRASGRTVDVVAITAVSEAATVRAAVAAGVVNYLIKPFAFSALRDKLDAYRDYADRVGQAGRVHQHDLDRAFSALRTTNDPGLPKGLSAETLDAVAGILGEGAAVSASELAGRIGVSRVTARRYLEFLAESGRAERGPRHGARGRPEVEYRLA